jgi:hypothetical protein
VLLHNLLLLLHNAPGFADQQVLLPAASLHWQTLAVLAHSTPLLLMLLADRAQHLRPQAEQVTQGQRVHHVQQLQSLAA